MKIRKEALILGLVIIVLSLYLIFNKSDRSLYELPILEPVSGSEISKITLDSSNATVFFIRKSGQWVINEEAYPGDDASIKRVVDIVAGLSLTTLISESKNYERYDLNPGRKITVKAWTGDTLVREFDVGKTASGNRHTFVRLAGDHRVYHAEEGFRERVQTKADIFREKTVLSFERDQIEQVQVLKEDKQDIYLKDKTHKASGETASTPETTELAPIWKNVAGKTIKANRLSKLIDDFSSLKCSAYIYERQKSEFKTPIATITFKGAEAYSVQIYEKMQKEDSGHPAVSSQSEYPFIVPGWQVEQAIKALTDIELLEKEDTSDSE